VRKAVYFDRELSISAIEVEDKRSDWMLSAEAEAADFAAAKQLPENDLRQGHFAAHALGAAKASR
jgi:hypothetical protein